VQTLQDSAPKQVEYLKSHYVAASKGNFDIYVVFVERGLRLLQAQGNLSYILPHKFFNAQYGQPLRKMLADGRHVSHVVHFGDHQIFPGATNYICLLFLERPGALNVRFVKVIDVDSWYATRVGLEDDLPAASFSDAVWTLSIGPEGSLFDKLSRKETKMADIADRIFQGIIPGADKVYALELLNSKAGRATCFSRALNAEVAVEPGLLRKIVSGTEVQSFIFAPSCFYVIYPYTVEDGHARLIEPSKLRREFPLTYDYFSRTRKLLNQRDRGSARGVDWYRYIRTQNIALQTERKLAVPRLVSRLRASYDDKGIYCLDNVDVGGIVLRSESGCSYLYVLGLLNSKLLNFFFIRNSVPFRGGFFSANRQYIENLPVVLVAPSDKENQARQDRLVHLVKQIVAAKKDRAAGDDDYEQERFDQFCADLEREIDSLVYQLYELTEDEIALVERST
jgi:hypothetical protein